MPFILASSGHYQLARHVVITTAPSSGAWGEFADLPSRGPGRGRPAGSGRRRRRRRRALGFKYVRPSELAATASPTSAKRRSSGTVRSRASHNAIVRQDRHWRRLPSASRPEARDDSAKTGLPRRLLSAKDPLTRPRPGAPAPTRDNWRSTVDTGLVQKLTSHSRYITDASNARGRCCSISTRCGGTPEPLDLFGIPTSLPRALVGEVHGHVSTTLGIELAKSVDRRRP